MKKIMRSKITKTVAFLLLIASAVSFGCFVIDFVDYCELNSAYKYDFDKDFESSECIYNSYWEAIDSLKYGTWDEIEAKLKKIPWIQYYIVGDGVVLSNLRQGLEPEEDIYFMLFDMYQTDEARAMEAQMPVALPPTDPIDVQESENQTYIMNGDGSFSPVEYSDAYIVEEEEDNNDYAILRVERFDGEERHVHVTPYTAFNSIKEAHVGMTNLHYNEMNYQWNKNRRSVSMYIITLASLLIFAVLMFAYLLVVCGRRPNDEEVHMLAIDRIFVEILLVGAFFICLAFFAGIMNALYLISNNMDAFVIGGLMSLCTAGFTATLTVAIQSVSRNIKNKTFLDRSIIVRVWRLFIRLVKKAWKELKKAVSYFGGEKTRTYVIGAFILYSLALGTLGRNFLFFVILAALGCIFLYKYCSQLDKIKEGIFQIRNGNTDYRITECTNKNLAETAEALNNINEGVKIGVEREVKAQRMKSELITNVSHDLKTPLTSIISYADLLSGMKLSPEEANDYAKIIKQKGDRLKKLTADLFDISKVESGNETVVFERLDARLLLKQTLAELNHEIEDSGLEFIEKIPEKEIFVRADGKKLSRVFENLVVNAVKYSMKGTRVYISAEEVGENIRIEFKNISNAPLNFDPNEITERFVRGDKNRSTEGSGLGLAIAKSYTELCGGKFEIFVDADLFKACVELKKA